MATSADYGSPRFSPSSSMTAARSPDTTSPIYPDRAIRPLPRSRLKSKLSPEQATTIVYPPEPLPISPTLQFSDAPTPVNSQHARLTNGGANGHHHSHISAHEHCTCGEEDDSGDDEVEFDHPDYRYATAMPTALNGITSKSAVQRKLLESSRSQMRAPGPSSTASSADGYESFENTSNKKKRKIPLSGASSMHHSSLSAEMASMGINNADGGLEQEETLHQHYGGANISSPSGTGISGAGRGRFGRQLHKYERRPLATSMNAVHGYNARLPRANAGGKPADNGVENADGIISQAIKTAAEHRPPNLHESQDNVSLLQSAASTATPKTQFTFACESESASKMAGQQAAVAAATYATNVRNNAPQSAQSQQLRHGPLHTGTNVRPPPPPAPVGQTPASAANPPPRPRPRRRLSREYALATRQRQLQQEYTNYHHRPTKGNMYICEFCEYEDIFGVPPVAMIRRYEAKDRDERKKAAERRRLLEKAKMKSRKGKKSKGGKNHNQGGSVANHHGQNAYDPDAPPGQDGEEYYDDEEYGDEYDPVDGEPYDDALQSNAYYPPPAVRSGVVPPAATPVPSVGSVGRPPPMAPT